MVDFSVALFGVICLFAIIAVAVIFIGGIRAPDRNTVLAVGITLVIATGIIAVSITQYYTTIGDPPTPQFSVWPVDVWGSSPNSTTITSTVITSSVSSTVNTSSSDYQLWIYPYLSQLEQIRQVLMAPYTIGNQHYGFDPAFDLIRGANIEPNLGVGVSGGYVDGIVAIDNNLEGSKSLDYFNSLYGITTNIYNMTRSLLSEVWNGVGACSFPFAQYVYPASFTLLDRREAELGFSGPYASTIETAGNHLGGIGSNCGIQGQTWFLPNYENPNTSPSQPLIVTEFPSSQPIASTGDLEELSFFIDQAYMQCIVGTAPCSTWQNAYINAMSQFPFGAPREALHFVQATRATGAWTLSNMTYNGISAYSMLQDTITQIFTQATGIDGGLYQNWVHSGSSDTPEPNLQAMIAFDPRMPSWFVKP